MKPNAETVEILRHIQTEIGAGMVLKFGGLSSFEQAHNNACARACSIVQNYKEGIGLFQLTRKPSAHPEVPEPGSQNPPINQDLLEACEAVIEVNANGMTAAEGVRVVEMCRRAVARAKALHA